MAANTIRHILTAGALGASALSLSKNVFIATAERTTTGTPATSFFASGTTLPPPASLVSAGRLPAIPRDEKTQRMFQQFVDEWTQDTKNLSDASLVLLHPAYHRILAMGTSVLPYIVDDLTAGDGARWLPALDAITLGQINPVPPEHEDDAELMCQDWLQWWNNEFVA